MPIVVEASTVQSHQLVQLALPGMAERWMADVVNQGKSLDQLRVQAQSRGHGTRDLRHFDRMRQPVTKMIGEARREDLSLGFQAPESPRMHDTVAIASVFTAVTVQWFWITAAARSTGVHGPGRKCETYFDEPLRGFCPASSTDSCSPCGTKGLP